MIYYKTSLFTYNNFIAENKSNRLSKTEKIESSFAICKYLTNIKKLNEIFDTEIDNLEYRESGGDYNTTYFFKSKRGNEYRLDLIVLIEENGNLKDKRLHDKKFISVSFSTADVNIEDYDNATDLDELYDIMSRIRYLIKLNEWRTKSGFVFMFGKPDDKKINMYKYFIKICFPDYILIKDFTSGFPNVNVGYYLLK